MLCTTVLHTSILVYCNVYPSNYLTMLYETRMFRNKSKMNNLRLSIVDVSPKSYEVRFLRIAKTQITAKDEDQQNMDCVLYWNYQIQQRRHLSASLISTTLARQ